MPGLFPRAVGSTRAPPPNRGSPKGFAESAEAAVNLLFIFDVYNPGHERARDIFPTGFAGTMPDPGGDHTCISRGGHPDVPPGDNRRRAGAWHTGAFAGGDRAGGERAAGPDLRHVRPLALDYQHGRAGHFLREQGPGDGSGDGDAAPCHKVDRCRLHADRPIFHPDAFPNMAQAFDPTSNADYGARFLVQLFGKTNSWPKAVEFDHSATLEIGQDYGRRVYAAWPEEQRLAEANEPYPLTNGWASTVNRSLLSLPLRSSAAHIIPLVPGLPGEPPLAGRWPPIA